MMETEISIPARPETTMATSMDSDVNSHDDMSGNGFAQGGTDGEDGAMTFGGGRPDRMDMEIYGAVLDVDSVDWGSVARAYRILRLYPGVSDGKRPDERLSASYHKWLGMSENRIEFDIALRMCFEESLMTDRYGEIIENMFRPSEWGGSKEVCQNTDTKTKTQIR